MWPLYKSWWLWARLETLLETWKTRSIPGDAWNDSFSFRTFRSYPNVCLCRKELLCGRSQLWHPFAHILCVTPRLHWQMVTSISFMKHNQQTNPKPNHQKTNQTGVRVVWVLNFLTLTYDLKSSFPFLLSWVKQIMLNYFKLKFTS